MSTPQATRMCPECLTTDAAFPLTPDCQSCKDTLAQDEFEFWNTPIFWEEGSQTGMTPHQFMRRISSPWIALYNLITLT
jgi:hypothetical protein